MHQAIVLFMQSGQSNIFTDQTTNARINNEVQRFDRIMQLEKINAIPT
jgi:hypothetical protein